MQLQTFMTTMVCNINIIIVVKIIDLDISCNDSRKHNNKMDKILIVLSFGHKKYMCFSKIHE
jgi:hypothetical protein